MKHKQLLHCQSVKGCLPQPHPHFGLPHPTQPHSTSSLLPFVCPFLFRLPSLFRGFFILPEPWMRGCSRLQKQIKPPSHAPPPPRILSLTHTHGKILTYTCRCRNGDECALRCITNPVNTRAVQVHTNTLVKVRT